MTLCCLILVEMMTHYYTLLVELPQHCSLLQEMTQCCYVLG